MRSWSATARLTVAGTGTFEHRSFRGNPWTGAWRRCVWQRDPVTGWTAHDAQVVVDVDADGLPTGVRADGVAFAVAAAAVVPAGTRVVLALLAGETGRGWLEWCPGAAGPGRPPPG